MWYFESTNVPRSPTLQKKVCNFVGGVLTQLSAEELPLFCLSFPRRCLYPARGLVLESRDQQTSYPFVHLLREGSVCMHWKPDILPIAPDMVGQSDGHRWRALGVTLTQALVRHHKVVEADHQPDPAPVTAMTPGQTPGAAPQGCDQSPQRPISAFHESRLDRRAKLPQTPLRDKATRTTEDHASADRHHMASRVTDLDNLGVE